MQCILFYFVLVQFFLNLKFKSYNYGTLLCTKEMNQSLMQLCLENKEKKIYLSMQEPHVLEKFQWCLKN
jgi:hypothetical protein